MNIADLAHLFENIVRSGTVEAVQMQRPRVGPATIGEPTVLLSPTCNLAQSVVLTRLLSELIPASGKLEDLHRRTQAKLAFGAFVTAAGT